MPPDAPGRLKEVFRRPCAFLNFAGSLSSPVAPSSIACYLIAMNYAFANCILDMRRHELLVDGDAVPVEPQVFEILFHLLEHAGELVTQDELIDWVWKGRIVSDSAISARISSTRSAIGDSGSEQKLIKTVPRKGFIFVAEVTKNNDFGRHTKAASTLSVAGKQKIRFCHSADGTRIGFATTGEGYPVLKTGNWLTHLEHDWHSPVWRPFFTRWSDRFQLTRYDQRGNGLSDWTAGNFSLAAFTQDFEAVVEASGLDQFAIYSSSQGVPVAINYAANHPERVSHLILHGGYEQGRLIRQGKEEREQGEAILTLIRHGWGKPDSALLQAFASFFIPGRTREQIDSLVDLQRLTTSPDNAAIIREAVDHFDVSDLLEKIDTPTLVIHARNDGVQPLDQGYRIAAGIKHAQFVMLESPNHVILEHEPAWVPLFDAIHEFLPDR